MKRLYYYYNEDGFLLEEFREIKVGHIVVIRNGIANGNKAGVITRVSMLNHQGVPCIICENKTPGDHQPFIKYWAEYPGDMRPATKEERRQYFHEKWGWKEVSHV